MTTPGSSSIVAVRAFVHEGAVTPATLWQAWSAPPAVIVGLALATLLYVRGRALRRYVGARRHKGAAFAAGLFTLAIALVSPLHALGETLFSAHMAQHIMLMGVAAPLLVVARPLAALLRGMPAGSRKLIVARLRSGPARRAAAILEPAPACVLHAAVLWAWHVPAAYRASITHDAVHAVQHTTFLFAALVFWSSVLRPGRGGHGVAVLSLFITTMHTGVLGALIATAPSAWFPELAPGAAAWRLSALEDQQLAGLIMWVPGAVPFLIGGLIAMARWLDRSRWMSVRMRWAGGSAQPAAVTGRRSSGPAIGRRPDTSTHRRGSRVGRGVAGASIALAITIAATGCGESDHWQDARILTGGDPARGRTLIRRNGCAACHTIEGVPGANAAVGPPLDRLREQVYIAGVLLNTPDNLIRWIQDPKGVDSLTAMPTLGISRADARDIASYLYAIDPH